MITPRTNAAAEREFRINEKIIRDGIKKKTQLEALERPLKKMRQNSSPVEALERELIDPGRQGYIVTRGTIRLRALK